MTETCGRLSVRFPYSFAYPVTVAVATDRDGIVVVGEYRQVLRLRHVADQALTDDELEWLIGFDDDVAAHETQCEAVLDRIGSRS